MKLSCIPPFRTLAVSTLLAAALVQPSPAQNATTDPVGVVTTIVPAFSDAVVAVPMCRASVFKGIVQSINGNTITIKGTPNWVTNQFVQILPSQPDTYALQIASGSKEGMVGTIVSNTADTITIQLDAGDSLAGIKSEAVDGLDQGDHIDIIPYWTPSTLFGTIPPAGTELHAFENAPAGINYGSSEIFAHAGNNEWEDGVNGGDVTHARLRFGAAFIFRNNSGSEFKISFLGAVPMNAHRVRLSTSLSNSAQDIPIGYISPVPESLSTVGMNPPATNPSPNALNFPANVGDAILGFDNSAPGINKGASEIYAWNGSAWEDDINGGVIDSTVQIKPTFGYIYRKAATATPQSVVWSNVQSYLQ